MADEAHDSSPRPAVPVFPYRGPVIPYRSGPTGVTYVRTADTLVITIPSAPFFGQVLHRVTMLALAACFTVAMAFIAIAGSRDGDPAPALIFGSIAAIFGWTVVFSIKRTIYTLKDGKQPSTLAVGSDGLRINTAGTFRHRAIHIVKERIFDLQVIPPSSMRGSDLTLQVITRDDDLHVVRLPWRDEQPMIELEDNLRDVLGLPPTRN